MSFCWQASYFRESLGENGTHLVLNSLYRSIIEFVCDFDYSGLVVSGCEDPQYSNSYY